MFHLSASSITKTYLFFSFPPTFRADPLAQPAHNPICSLLFYQLQFRGLQKGSKLGQFELPVEYSFSAMNVDGGTSAAASASSSVPPRSSWEKALHNFTQQSLPACKPVLTPAWVISTFLVVGIAFVPVGLVSLHASNSVVEIVDQYDIECVPDAYKTNKVAFIRDDSISKNCTRLLKVVKWMKAPIYIYYQLDNYYQNHRRYVKSRSDKQLLHGLQYNDSSSCNPEESNKGLPIVPCGLVAWSLFNDSYIFNRGEVPLKVSRKDIAWRSDRDHKFGKQVYPFNFQNGTLIGGGKLDPSIPLSDQEDLIVWMRTAALPTFRKLYGRIEEDLHPNDLITVNLTNNYNTYASGGTKKLVLSTSSWLGGKNDFLGAAYMFVGSSCTFISLVFLLLHLKDSGHYGDAPVLSWNRKSAAV